MQANGSSELLGDGTCPLPTFLVDSPTLPVSPSAARHLSEHHGPFQHCGDGVVVYKAGEGHRAPDPQGEQPGCSHAHDSELAEWPTTNCVQPDECFEPRDAKPDS